MAALMAKAYGNFAIRASSGIGNNPGANLLALFV
jgi:hypothetical protein